jgi:hypothetical protein
VAVRDLRTPDDHRRTAAGCVMRLLAELAGSRSGLPPEAAEVTAMLRLLVGVALGAAGLWWLFGGRR